MRPLFQIILLVLAALIIVIYILAHPPLDIPEGTLSQRYYERGTHGVRHEALDLVDPSRATMANHEFKGRESREFNGRIWLPADKEGAPYPLVVYSHGYMSQYKEADYLLNFLASHGYVAVSVNFPLSNGSAPGGAIVSDILNQSGDVSFVINQMLARNRQADSSLYGMIDEHQIAAVGLSLGGLTTELAALHPKLKDPRIATAISIAGPSEFLTPDFFAGDTIPFMYIGATADAIVPYPVNAQPIPTKYDNALLVTLQSGSHVGFIDMAPVIFRWFNNPDQLGCAALMRGLKAAQGTEPVPKLGALLSAAGGGVDTASGTPPCQTTEFVHAMRPARQHSLVVLAIYSFLESQFSSSEATRKVMHDFLFNQLSTENSDIAVSGH